MNTITVPGFFYLQKAESWQTPMLGALAGMTPTWGVYDPTGCSGILLAIPHALTLALPDGFDPRPAQVADLRKKKAEAAAAAHALDVEFSRQINELQAIEQGAAVAL